MNSKSLAILKQLQIGPIIIEPKRIKAPYRVTTKDGEQKETELIYSYEEKVFDSKSPESINLASMMAVQVGINYGLFFEEIIFDGFFDDTDKRFIQDMIENTSREIYVNKFLLPNEFIKTPYNALNTEKQKRYTNADVTFKNSSNGKIQPGWKYRDNSPDSYAILSSGGKDSLLTYGIMKELGKSVHPVFINESGRHWFTALNSYRYFQANEPNTSRVWCNSDRVFNWMLRNLPIVREDFSNIRADIYPIRLWTVAVFLFGVLPIVHKRGIGRVLIGDEYDTTVKSNYEGITHYNSLFDQSKYFDNALTRFFLKKGWSTFQFSILRSLSELLIMKVLTERYPQLQEQQISCHAAHEENGRIYPCGNCEKCRRIVGMLMALDRDPGKCGYNPEQIKKSLESLGSKKVKQIGPDSSQLFYLLHQKGLIPDNEHTRKLAKPHPYIVKLRFDRERSNLADIPFDIRKPLLNIFLQHAGGAVELQNRKWEDFNIMESNMLNVIYPFEVRGRSKLNPSNLSSVKKEFMWEHLSWKEIEERLKIVDTAILPCGSIEQHGPHLPVDVDYFDAVYLAAKVAELCSEPKPFVLPPIPYGVSYHHEEFKGTLSVTNDALSKFVYDIGLNLARNGIKKLIILNGHGDNSPTLQYAAQMINRDANIFVCVETGETSDIDIDDLINTQNDIHAGEIETSTTLALRPDFVNMEEALNETLSFGSSFLDFTSSRGVAWYVRTKRISKSGIMGDASKATAEKGKKIWEIMTAHLVRFVEEIKRTSLDDLYQKRY
jgi:creatinine amidohydrolase/Fe(II)-dependent formamide hydrolase-like protein